MMIRLVSIPLFLVGIMFTGCSLLGLGNGDNPIEIRTDKKTYSIQDSMLEIKVSYINKISGPAYIPVCGEEAPAPLLKKKVEDEWVDAYATCRATDGSPLTIAPDSTYRFSYQINTEDSTAWKADKLAGTYRLEQTAFEIYDADTDRLAKETAHVSEVFTVR